MKRAITAIAAVVILGHSAWGDAGEADKIARMFKACIPTNWTVAPAMKALPVRGLSNAIAQFTFTETTKMLGWESSPGRTNTFRPTLALLAFGSARAREIEEAVEREQNHSDYPPLIFCVDAQYVFVTSPGYINRGLHTPEAEASLRDLKEALAKCLVVKYNLEPAGAANPDGSGPIRSETNRPSSASAHEGLRQDGSAAGSRR